MAKVRQNVTVFLYEQKFEIDFLLIATIHRDMVAIFPRAHCTATDTTVWRNPNGK